MRQSSSVSFDEAVELSLELAKSVLSTEWVHISEALGRVLGKDIFCQKNLPSYNNAAMDGFAFAFQENSKQLRIKKRILAGENSEPCLELNECYKIMTGAKVPSDADTIVPFESCVAYDDENVTLPLHVKQGSALRIKGEEQSTGSLIACKGESIDASMVAILASQGITHIEVFRKLSIVVLSTGDELRKPWESASEDEIYDINASALIALLKENGFEAHYGGVMPDNLLTATSYFSTLKAYDVVVTSGGVSMGEADFVEKALIANGFEASFHGINIKPGKPTMIGHMGETLVVSLPGNPLAAYVNAFLFLIPALRKKQGQKKYYFDYFKATNTQTLPLKSGRVNLVLGEYSNGSFTVCQNNRYGSGMITPLQKSNCVMLTAEETEVIEAGSEVKILFFKPIFSGVIELLKN